MKYEVYQTLPDQKLLANDCTRNSFKIQLEEDIEIEVNYDINLPDSRQLALAVINKIAESI